MKILYGLKILSLRSLVIGFSLITLLFITNSVHARSINDFINAQGSIIFNDPVKGGILHDTESFIWGSSGTGAINNYLYRVDYAGKDEKALAAVKINTVAPIFIGTIDEQRLPNGNAEDTVYLTTIGAISFVVDATDIFNNISPSNCDYKGDTAFIFCPALFGYNMDEMANGVGMPVLGITTMIIKFVNTAPGAPIPDMVNLTFTPGDVPYLETWNLIASAVGPLRSAYGVKNGTPGLATVTVMIDTSKSEDNELVTLKKL